MVSCGVRLSEVGFSEFRKPQVAVSDDAAPIEKVGLVYPSRISIDRSTIQVEGKQVNLSPGMARDSGSQDGEASADRMPSESSFQIR